MEKYENIQRAEMSKMMRKDVFVFLLAILSSGEVIQAYQDGNLDHI
jgi:hypothetical protein